MKHLKTPQELNEASENLNISDVIGRFDDFDEQNYEIAKIIFLKEEGREPNMNITKEMNLVAAIEVGVRYARTYL